jgi:hypothetical protein
VIEFRWSKMDKQDNTPILKDTEIDELAEMLLADYKPQLLKEPTPINHLHFLESYLGANIRRYGLSHPLPAPLCTSFEELILDNTSRLKGDKRSGWMVKSFLFCKNPSGDWYVTPI